MPISVDAAVEGLLANRSKLLAYIWSLLRDHHATEDVFEEVVLAAMKHFAEIKDQDHLLAWARQTARFRGIDYLRRKSREPQLLAEDVLDQLESQWRQRDADNERDCMDALRTCYKQLSTRSQTIVSLRYGQGLSGREVAAVMGRKVHSVYVAMTRIYQTLEECVRRTLAVGDPRP
jgi:RNA polymerase sigma-70 factor, ECF subfamily